jgi:hypothetical protein
MVLSQCSPRQAEEGDESRRRDDVLGLMGHGECARSGDCRHVAEPLGNEAGAQPDLHQNRCGYLKRFDRTDPPDGLAHRIAQDTIGGGRPGTDGRESPDSV